MIICIRLREKHHPLFSRVSMEVVNGEVRHSIRKLEFFMSMPMKWPGLWRCVKTNLNNLRKNHGYKLVSDFTSNTVPLVTASIERVPATTQRLLTSSQNIRKKNS